MASFSDVRFRLEQIERGIAANWISPCQVPDIIYAVRRTACAGLWTIAETRHINEIIRTLSFRFGKKLPLFERWAPIVWHVIIHFPSNSATPFMKRTHCVMFCGLLTKSCSHSVLICTQQLFWLMLSLFMYCVSSSLLFNLYNYGFSRQKSIWCKRQKSICYKILVFGGAEC